MSRGTEKNEMETRNCLAPREPKRTKYLRSTNGNRWTLRRVRQVQKKSGKKEMVAKLGTSSNKGGPRGKGDWGGWGRVKKHRKSETRWDNFLSLQVKTNAIRRIRHVTTWKRKEVCGSKGVRCSLVAKKTTLCKKGPN